MAVVAKPSNIPQSVAVDNPEALSYETRSRTSKFDAFYGDLTGLKNEGDIVTYPCDESNFDAVNADITRALTSASKRVPPPEGMRYARKIAKGKIAVVVQLVKNTFKPRKPRTDKDVHTNPDTDPR